MSSRPIVNRCVFAYLGTILTEELGGIHAVDHGAANKGEPVENHRRVGGVREEQLLGDIEEDGDGEKASNGNGDLRANALLKVELRSRMAEGILEDAHRWGLGGRLRIVEMLGSPKKENLSAALEQTKENNERDCRPRPFYQQGAKASI
jgi:hypothetical protein